MSAKSTKMIPYKLVDRKHLLAILEKNFFDLKDCCKECLYCVCEKKKNFKRI